MVKSDIMLKHFHGEYILILTNQTMMTGNETHQEEVPMVFEGVLIDYDDCYLMIGASEESPAELVNRDIIMRISQSMPITEEVPEGATIN